jgi:acetyl-CoA carboxylase biotin carboxyl carrier protein
MSEQDTPSNAGGKPAPHERRDERRAKFRAAQPPGQGRAPHPEPALNMDEMRELFKLIDALMTAHHLTDFEIEREGFRVRLGRSLLPPAPSTAASPAEVNGPIAPAAAAPQPPPPVAVPAAPTTAIAPPAPAAEVARAEDEDLAIITSPIVGTFYRASSPTAEPFVRVGSKVEPDTVVCIIEAMKLMNEIQAETSGTVAKIFVENGQPVEYGQALFGIKK